MRKFWNVLWRSLVLALIYTAANALIGALVMQGVAAPQATPANPTLLLATTFASGFLLGAVLGPVASLLTGSRMRSILIWTVLIYLNLGSVVLEGYFFAPGLLPLALVPRILVLQALSTVIAAIGITLLFPVPATPTNNRPAAHRSPLSWTGRFLASAAAYLVFYYGFGAINYALVTGPYYETHGGLAVPAPATVIAVEGVRSVLIILSLLPLITFLHLPRRKLAVRCGFLLFMIGGVLPLLSQTAALPPVLLVASGVEIFFQNFLTGVVAAGLLWRPAAPAVPLRAVPVAEAADHA
jgi:hypothetical protein